MEAVGTGLPEPGAATDAQRKYTSQEAALMDAQSKILLQVQNLRHRGTSAAARDPQGLEKVKGMLRGVTATKTEWDETDRCTVTLRLDQRTLQRIDALLLRAD